MWQEEWFMVSPMCFSFYIMPGFWFFFNFIVHLVLFNPFLLKKFGQEQRWAQYPELETPAREEWSTTAMWWKLQETQTGGCSSQMQKRRGENNIWKGKRKEKTNFLPSPSGKSIKEKKNCSKSLLVNKQKVSGTGTSGNEGNKCYSGKIKIGDAKGR